MLYNGGVSHQLDDAVPESRALVPGLVLAATILAAYAGWGRTTQPSLATQSANADAVFAAVVIFAAFCARSRRWLALPVALSGAMALGAIHTYTRFKPVDLYDPAVIEGRVDDATRRLAELDRASEDVAAWRAGRLPANSMPYGVSGANPLFLPGLPFGIPIRGTSFAVASFSGPAGGNAAGWERFGEGWAREIPGRRRRIELELAATKAGLAQPPLAASEEVRLWAMESAALTAVLLPFNALALVAMVLPRRRSRAVIAG